MNSPSGDRRVEVLSLRLTSQMVVMIGWSIVLLHPFGVWNCADDLRSDGMNALCGSFDSPTVYFWLGVTLIVVGTVMQFTVREDVKGFLYLCFVGFCGGICLLGVSVIAQAVYVPWAVATFVFLLLALGWLTIRRRVGKSSM